jgi:hypothetical protein
VHDLTYTHVNEALNEFSNTRPGLTFTSETEQNNSISFSDVMTETGTDNSGFQLEFTIYRKQTTMTAPTHITHATPKNRRQQQFAISVTV